MHAGRSKWPKNDGEDKSNPFYAIKKNFSSKWSSLAAAGNTTMNLPWYPKKIVHFS
jgi:hypothetical protein